jgi:hypothetical protein
VVILHLTCSQEKKKHEKNAAKLQILSALFSPPTTILARMHFSIFHAIIFAALQDEKEIYEQKHHLSLVLCTSTHFFLPEEFMIKSQKIQKKILKEKSSDKLLSRTKRDEACTVRFLRFLLALCV